MTATLHSLGTGRNAGLYYTNDPNREARSRGRDEYYTRDGGGVWHSTGQTIVTHGAAVEAETFRDLCAGIDPGTGKALVRGAGERHKAGLDITFTPGKSISILWMSGTKVQRDLIEAGHRAAVNRALQFVLDEKLVVVRHGAGGIHREQPSDLLVARFDHFTTRAGDPNVHSHCIVMNVAGSPVVSKRYASKHLTIETDFLFKWQRTLGSAYRSSLAEQLQKAGFQFRAAGQGQWEIAGIPQDLLEVFSKRSHAIEDLVGRDATAAQKEIAALSTRAGKETVLTGDALEAHWKAELEQTGIDPWQLAFEHGRGQHRPEQLVERDLFQEPPAIAGPTPVAVAASKLFLTENVLDRQRLLETAMVEASLQGLGPDAVYAELTQLEQAGSLLRLDEAHWTTPAIATIEASMIRAATRPAEREWITLDALTASLNSASHLTHEQSLAVRSAARSDGVSLIEAGAGTGKTTLAKAIVQAARLSGLNVVGLAPSWVAAEELGASTGVPAQAVARWRYDLDHGLGAPMTASTLILLDEAGMAGTRDMAAVLIAAKEASAKVVLLGDRRQLQSVSGASALAAIADVVEQGMVLDNVRRQKVEWQRAASVLMARGDAEAGLRAYARNDRIELVAGESATRARVIAQWSTAREIHGDDVLMITRRNIDAVALNLEARVALQETGRLDTQEVILPAIGRDQKLRDLAISVGEKLRFGETLPALGIRNGSRAVVETVVADGQGDASLELRMESGELVTVNWSELTRPRPGDKALVPRISHGYAGTAYAVQGRTAAATVLHIGRKTDAREIYVALTRHQHDAYLVVEAGRLDAACRQRQEDPRLAPTSTALLERLFVEATHYREKANVIDYVADRQSFIAGGVVELPQSRAAWDIVKFVKAAQRLQSFDQVVHRVLALIGKFREIGLALEVKLPIHFAELKNPAPKRGGGEVRRNSGPDLDR